MTDQKDSDRTFDGLVQRLAESVAGHPGFMWTTAGFEVLHADWPAYPRGHGRGALLETLGDYPPGTTFFSVDHIDNCTLFVAGRPPWKDKFARNLLHIALWDDDLRLAARRGYVDGIDDAGEFLSFRGGHMTLARQGETAILLHELTRGMPDELLARVWEDLEAGRYDTAIREACVLLEVRMKRAAGDKAYGVALVDLCFGPSGRLVPATLPNADRNLSTRLRQRG